MPQCYGWFGSRIDVIDTLAKMNLHLNSQSYTEIDDDSKIDKVVVKVKVQVKLYHL